MNKTRIYELAKILKVTSKEIISKANELNIAVKSHSNSLSEDEVKLITESFTIKPQIKNTSNTVKITLKDKEETSLEEHIQKAFSNLQSIEDFALLINKVNKTIYEHAHKVEVKHLTYHAYHSKDKYQVFEIPKKSGGIREIYAPSKGLKYILKTLNVIFQALHKPQSVAHGFLPNRSVVTNAKLHVDKNYVYNIDLENFFPNIHQARVWKRLQYPPFNLGGKRIEIANLLANLACFQYEQGSSEKNFLPQGAPTSPILSNIICHRLDKKLLELAKAYNVKYTRYADDMTFSSDHNVYQENSGFLQKLFSIIQSENFKVNTKKTRLQKRGYKQEVTGLIVNEKINVSRSYIKNLRALIHLVEKYGDEKAQKIFAQKNGSKSLEQVIFGKLQYLKMVKRSEDGTYKTLHQKTMDVYKMIESSDIVTPPPPISNNSINHNPKILIDILNKFRDGNSPFKACVHSELYLDNVEHGGYGGDYQSFMMSVKNEFESISDALKNLSPRLHAKIYAFLFSEKLGEKKDSKYFYTWGEKNISFGWSSPDLKEWCLSSNKNDPFKYNLQENKVILQSNLNISTFLDVCNLFKNEIEVRDDNNILLNLLDEIELWLEKLNKGFILELEDKEILGKTFFTDFHWLSKGLKKIFEGISKREQHKTIKINMTKINSLLELRIMHIGSNSQKDAKVLLSESNFGDVDDIKKYFRSLCDWSIEARHLDENFRINYLKSEEVACIEYLDDNIEGFTHILRFYK